MATLCTPSGSGAHPTAYFVHGGGWGAGGRLSLQPEAQAWTNRGWTTVNIAYRLQRSGVKGHQMVDDIWHAVRHFERNPRADPGRQVIYGSSVGGGLAALVAMQHPEHFRAVIAWSPVADPGAAVKSGEAAQGVLEQQPDLDDAARYIVQKKVNLGHRARDLFGPSYGRYDPAVIATAASPRLFVIAGTSEWIDFASQSQPLCDALGTRCRALLLPTALHADNIRSAFPAVNAQARRYADDVVG